MRDMQLLKERALQKAEETPKDASSKDAFGEYAKMAKYLDDNFAPVEAVPQTAPMPVVTDQYVWHACSAEANCW